RLYTAAVKASRLGISRIVGSLPSLPSTRIPERQGDLYFILCPEERAVLSYREATAFRTWIGVAGSWSEAAQGLVGAASTLATVSSDLADLLERQARSGDRAELACQLRLLA